MPEVKIYTRKTCGPCKAVKFWLSRKNVPYTEIDVDQEPEAMTHVIQRSGFQQVPMIEVGDSVISGGNIGALARSLNLA